MTASPMGPQMRILMVVASPVTTDARVLREAQALVGAGYSVHVLGKDIPAGARPPAGMTFGTASGGAGLHGAAGATTGRGGRAMRAARWMLLPEHRALSFRRWATEAGRLAADSEYDVVHVHDFTALRLGSRLANARQVPLIYDSHELWSERRRTSRPTPILRLREQRAEKRLGGRAAAVLTVGEALAQQLRSSYGWAHVSVVRNTFPRGPHRQAPARKSPAAAVYAGRLGAGRDLETVAAASETLSMPVQLVGPIDLAWSARFNQGRCSVLPSVPVDAVGGVLSSAGLALVTLEPGCGNHEIALPNKLFHAIRAGVPIVASDVGELARTVRAHGIGVLYRPGDAASLIMAVEEARRRYPELVAAVQRAADELSWDRDQETLLGVYERLGR